MGSTGVLACWISPLLSLIWDSGRGYDNGNDFSPIIKNVCQDAGLDPLMDCWRRKRVMRDPIVEEIRKVREAHAARFNNDLDAICEDIRKHEELSGRTFIRLPPRKASSARWSRH